MTDWIPIDTRPLATGYYLVGHAGHQEKLSFFSPVDREWMPRTVMGWRRLTSKGWIRDDPVERFRATHCAIIEPPPRPRNTAEQSSTPPLKAGE